MKGALALVGVTVCAAVPGASAETYPDLDVFRVDARGHVTDMSANPALETSPSPSPDGSRIAFVSTRSGPAEIYVMSASGGVAARLTTSPFDDNTVVWNEAGQTSIAWAPDGKRIAFDVQNATYPPTCQHDCVVWSVYVANADGGGLRLVASQARSPAWSRDGRLLAYESGVTPYGEGESVSIDRLDGSPPHSVVAFNVSADVGPVWSPRRNELAFQTSNRWVHTMRADGTGRHRLARGLYPAWSPDGGSIAFALGGSLYRMSRTGSRIRRVASGWSSVGFPAWSPGGRAIAFFASPGKSVPQVVAVPAAGGKPQRLAVARGDDGSLSWVGRTGRLVFVRCASASACPY